MAKLDDVEIKEPIKSDKVEKPVEKQASLPIRPKKVVGFKVTKRDGKIVKSEPIYS